MNSQKITYFFLVILLVGMPLFFNTYSDDEFTVNKTSFFRLLILVILPIFLYFLFRHFSDLKNRLKKFSPYFIILGLYLIVGALATIFSNSPFLSFFGSSRQYGWLQFFFYFSFFFIAILVLRSKKAIIRLLYFLVASSFVVSVWGILEYFDLRSIWYPVYDKGVASTLGHPSFLGAYLVMIIPVTIGLVFIVSSSLSKKILSAVVLLQFLVLFLTETRAAWIALVLSFFMAVIFVLIKKKKPVLLSLLGVLFVGLIVFFISTGVFNQIFNYQAGSGALRIIWWNQAAEAIQKKPLLGYGFDNQEEVLMAAYHPLQGVYSNYSLRTDRAHNEILDQLLTTGIFGLVLFFSFVILLFKEGITCFIKTQDKKQQIILIALLTGLIAYFVQGMFSFSVSVLYIYFWLFSALVIILVRGEQEKDFGKKEVL